MNKRSLIIGILLSVFILTTSAVNFTEAQVPKVPEPTCSPAPGIPCPGDWKTNILPEKQPSKPASDTGTGENISQLFDYLAVNINKIINDIKGGFQNIFDGLRKIKNYFL